MNEQTDLIVNDMPVETSPRLGREEAMVRDEGSVGGPPTLIMHPLMAIELANLDDPLAQLDQAIEWILQDGARRFDRLAADLHVAGTEDRRIIAEADMKNALRRGGMLFDEAVAAIESAERALREFSTIRYGRPE